MGEALLDQLGALHWKDVADAALGQFGALCAFFAFPAIQYVLLKFLARKEGQPELWYLPRYGFRLVIRNLPRRHTLSGIKYRAVFRTIIEGGPGVSVKTFDDVVLLTREDPFLFPHTDQVLVCFRLEDDLNGGLVFVHTDKLGRSLARFVVTDETRLIADFSAKLQNLFNFNVDLARRAEIFGPRLREIAVELAEDGREQCFDVSRVRDVG